MAGRWPRDPPRPVAETVTLDAGRSRFEGGIAFSVIRAFHSRSEIRATTAQPQSHHGEGIFSRHLEDQIRGPQLEEPARLPALQRRREVDGKSMKEHLRFAVAYWHTFRGIGWRPVRPRHGRPPVGRRHRLVENAEQSARGRLRVHREARRRLLLLPRPRRRPRRARPRRDQQEPRRSRRRRSRRSRSGTGIKLLWGTANLFCNPRYMHGAATSPQRRRLRLRRARR